MARIQDISPEELSKVTKPAAAGVLTITQDGHFLLTKRTQKAHYLPGYWSVPSGESEVNKLESMEDCARREFEEETTHVIPSNAKLICLDRYSSDDRIYFLFIYRVKSRFFVKIDWEHEDLGWFTKENLPSPMAPQILDAISRI
jgi:8-oxo-dGTP pyrophosphatase MutT (NUDIX family)